MLMFWMILLISILDNPQMGYPIQGMIISFIILSLLAQLFLLFITVSSSNKCTLPESLLYIGNDFFSHFSHLLSSNLGHGVC